MHVYHAKTLTPKLTNLEDGKGLCFVDVCAVELHAPGLTLLRTSHEYLIHTICVTRTDGGIAKVLMAESA